MMQQMALTFLPLMELGFVIIVFFLLFVLGRMTLVVKVLAMLMTDIKLVDLLAAQEELVLPVIPVASMTLLVIPAKRPAPVLVRRTRKVRKYVLVLLVLVHPNSGAVLFPAVKTVMILAQKLVNAVPVLFAIFLSYSRELLILPL